MSLGIVASLKMKSKKARGELDLLKKARQIHEFLKKSQEGGGDGEGEDGTSRRLTTK